uniref:Leucine-rich repeat-containing N-terminal plant-type domain-containing protein n=1 Tax=Lactuca sativa TaxID=4236 RepID=A0A9R1WDF6_LACSA|nr:hypothetical protein LSAT_V11C200095750 [Lactuca sativa]
MNAKLQIQPYVLNNLLQNSTHLREHLISGVDIGWALPTFLNISSSLKSLDLSRTSLHGNLPCNIFSLRYFEKLYLSNNDILGPLPQVIINQSSFKSLDLSNNGLQGKLPNNIFNIKYSEILDLSHNNNLTGLLPKINQSISIHLKSLLKSLVNLSRLTTIRLSDNILNGTLLFSLFTLPLLEDDYVGNNMLSGGLPKELFNYGSLKRLFLALSKIKRDDSLLTITLMARLIKTPIHRHLSNSKNSLPLFMDLYTFLLSLPNLQVFSLGNNGLSVITNNNSTSYVNPAFWYLDLAS